MKIIALQPDRFVDFIGLVVALAEYEKLDPPQPDAIDRLRADAFSDRPRYMAFLALDDADAAIGYAICFETYSSFLARPTMYLEDLFVLADRRTLGAGGALFDRVEQLARKNGCGRIDWQVLDWNMLARDFYSKRKAEWMNEWLLYRITL
ncbi:MAG: GNAT family N-acetyltransferase [Candidatus Kapabacteria bacterium]|nr:GNAT family N-acetyltransferase [Candidatus Kapabacteria bacterium]